MGYNPSYPAASNSDNADVRNLTVIAPAPTDTVLIITARGTFRTTVALLVAAVAPAAPTQTIFQDRTGSPPDDPTKPALSYPTGGGDLSQWDVQSQTWK